MGIEMHAIATTMVPFLHIYICIASYLYMYVNLGLGVQEVRFSLSKFVLGTYLPAIATKIASFPISTTS